MPGKSSLSGSATADLGLGDALARQTEDQAEELRKKKMREKYGAGPMSLQGMRAGVADMADDFGAAWQSLTGR